MSFYVSIRARFNGKWDTFSWLEENPVAEVSDDKGNKSEKSLNKDEFNSSLIMYIAQKAEHKQPLVITNDEGTSILNPHLAEVLKIKVTQVEG